MAKNGKKSSGSRYGAAKAAREFAAKAKGPVHIKDIVAGAAKMLGRSVDLLDQGIRSSVYHDEKNWKKTGRGTFQLVMKS